MSWDIKVTAPSGANGHMVLSADADRERLHDAITRYVDSVFEAHEKSDKPVREEHRTWPGDKPPSAPIASAKPKPKPRTKPTK